MSASNHSRSWPYPISGSQLVRPPHRRGGSTTSTTGPASMLPLVTHWSLSAALGLDSVGCCECPRLVGLLDRRIASWPGIGTVSEAATVTARSSDLDVSRGKVRRVGTHKAVNVTLSEAESRRLVASSGVTVSPFLTAQRTEELIAAVADDPAIHYPVVAKLCGRTIAHKTERGLVRLGLQDEHSLQTACDGLLAAAVPDDGQVELLVSNMIPGNRELIAGLTDDSVFGMTIMVGFGGILAEAVADVTFRLVPISLTDAYEMIDDLVTVNLLGEFRGEPAIDRHALAGTLVGLSRLGGEVSGIRSVDINPLVVAGGYPVAVDALVEVDPEAIIASTNKPPLLGNV